MELYGEVNEILAEGVNMEHLLGLLESDDRKETDEIHSMTSVTRGDTDNNFSQIFCHNHFHLYSVYRLLQFI